jgi:hypothetical protein
MISPSKTNARQNSEHAMHNWPRGVSAKIDQKSRAGFQKLPGPPTYHDTLSPPAMLNLSAKWRAPKIFVTTIQATANVENEPAGFE